MKKPVIAIDFDDTVNEFNRAFSVYNQKEHGELFDYEGLTTYNYKIDWGLSEEEQSHRVFDFWTHHQDSVDMMNGAKEALLHLSENFELHLVTSRCESTSKSTQDWLDKRVLEVFSSYHFTNSFSSKYPERKRNKLDVCREIDAVMLVDDAPVHANSLAEAGVPVIMFDRPWNQREVHHLVSRVFNWPEATDRINEFLSK